MRRFALRSVSFQRAVLQILDTDLGCNAVEEKDYYVLKMYPNIMRFIEVLYYGWKQAEAYCLDSCNESFIWMWDKYVPFYTILFMNPVPSGWGEFQSSILTKIYIDLDSVMNVYMSFG